MCNERFLFLLQNISNKNDHIYHAKVTQKINPFIMLNKHNLIRFDEHRKSSGVKLRLVGQKKTPD